MSHFVKGTKENNVPGRTDEHYHLPTDFEELRFVADIMLKQPEKSGTRLGYEYDVQFKSEPKVHNLVTDMTGHLPVFFEMPTDPAEKLPVAATIIPEGKSGKKEQKAA
jgi:hypothetical protein